jgi:hypothetical protein
MFRTALAAVLPLWPRDLADDSPRGRRRILARLRRALRAERRRGLSGHWTYDLPRHAELLRLYRLALARCLDGAGTSGRGTAAGGEAADTGDPADVPSKRE